MDIDSIPMQEVLKVFADSKIIPVATIQDTNNVEVLCKSLQAGGINCLEIVLRTDASVEALRLSTQYSNFLVGAGTVRSVDQADVTIQAGARFIVTPGFNPAVVRHCQERNIPVFPGVSTPTDLELAGALGVQVVKFFPAEAFGGVKTINALSAPYPEFRFIPTGGISASNLESYITIPQVIACGGSWMVKSNLIETDNFEEIKRLTYEAVTLANNIK